MRYFVFLIVTGLISFSEICAQGTWTWMNGPSSTLDMGNYVSKGSFSPAGMPCARYSACKWTDKNGKFWIFGGFLTSSSVILNDFWQYDPDKLSPTFNQWKWVGGDSNKYATVAINPVDWGTQGVPSATNKPPGKTQASAFWTDNNGDFWMFGGARNRSNGILGIDSYNDLWKYDFTLGQWIWMHGSNTPDPAGSYGTLHVANASNVPPPRSETTSTWVDDNGNLWLFGGVNNIGSDSSNFVSNYLNDLWKYDPSTNMWTWEAGDNIPNQPAVYGTQGVAAAANKPGARSAYTTWKVQGKKELWFFGGGKVDPFWGWEHYNDLWKYDIDPTSASYQQWIWMNGKNTPSDFYGVKGLSCVDSVTKTPSARMETRAAWVDSCDNFWLYGGITLLGFGSGHLGELWRYNSTANTWAYIRNGAVSSGTYGTKLVASQANDPAYKRGPAWWNNKDGFWMFAGEMVGWGVTNDMFLYKPDSIVPAFTYTVGTGCTSSAASFTENTSSGCGSVKSRLWRFGDGQTSTAQNPSHTYATANTYNVTLIVTNCSGKKDSVTTSVVVNSSAGFTISTSSLPAACGANNGSASVSIATGTGTFTYTWSGGATTPTASNIGAGIYTVTVSDGSCDQVSTVAVATAATFTISTSTSPSSCTSNNGSASVSTSVGGTYTYVWSGGATSQTALNLSTGSHTVTVSDGSCIQIATASVGTTSTFTITASSTPASCGSNNGSAVVSTSVAGTYIYTWSGGATTQTASNIGAGTYTVTVTDGSCTEITTTTVATINGHTAAMNTPVNISCNGSSDGSASVTVTGSASAYTYSWSNGASTATSATTNTVTVLPPGNYTVTITDSNGCTSTNTTSISEPTALSQTNSSAPDNCGGNTGVATVSAFGGTGPVYTYEWSSGPSFATSTSSTVFSLAANTYTVTVSDANNCSITTTVVVATSGSITVSAGNDVSICAGGSVQLNASGGTTYTWTPVTGLSNAAIADPVASPILPTQYIVTASSGSCTDKDTIVVSVNPLPSVSAGADVTITKGQSIQLNASGGTGYLWNPPSGLSNPAVSNPVADPTSTTTYTVVVTDINGCSDIATVTVMVNDIICGDEPFVPTAFSPNSDKQNDMLYVRGNCIIELEFKIFDRWGELVFETTDITKGWDGTFRNKPCDSGVFVYHLQASMLSGDQIIKKGNVTLVR